MAMSQGTGSEPVYAVVDVETSGLRPGRDHVLQVAVVTVDATGTVIDTLVDARTAAPLVAPRRPAPHPRHHPAIAAFGTGGARCVHRARQTARGQRVHRPQRRLRCRVHRARRSASKGSTGDRPAGVHARSVPAARSRSPAHPRIGRPVRSLFRPPDRPSRRPRRRHGDGSGAPPPAPCPAERWWRITRSAAGDAWRRGARDLATSPARRPRRPCRPAAAAVRASAR